MKKFVIINIIVSLVFIALVVMLIIKYTYAATIYYNGINVGYDNSTSGFKDSNNANIEEVQTALVELNKKSKNCPDVSFELGDYFTLVPDVANYSFPTSLSGYTSVQSLYIAGSSASTGLRLWRVIDIHSDGSVDAVSEYVSYQGVRFFGTVGYQNYIAGLQAIAAQFAKEGYTIDTRMMGYGGQTPSLGTITAFNGSINTAPSTTSTDSPTSGTGKEYNEGILGDTLYLKDYILVKNVYGTIGLKSWRVGTTSYVDYHIASRYYQYYSSNSFLFASRYINSSGNLVFQNLRTYSSSWSNQGSVYRIRPIITLKSGVTIASGSGTKASPYVLS